MRNDLLPWQANTNKKIEIIAPKRYKKNALQMGTFISLRQKTIFIFKATLLEQKTYF